MVTMWSGSLLTGEEYTHKSWLPFQVLKKSVLQCTHILLNQPCLISIHPPSFQALLFSVRSHSLVPCFSNISNALSQSAGYSLKVSVIYIKEFLSVLQPGYLTFTWSSSTLYNPLSPHPSLLPDLRALLLLIPPSSSSPADGLHPHN